MNRFLNYNQAIEIFTAIRNYIQVHRSDGAAKYISVDNGTPYEPDEDGLLNLPLGLSEFLKGDTALYVRAQDGTLRQTINNLSTLGTDPLATKSYVDLMTSNIEGAVKSVSINGGDKKQPDTYGNVDLYLQTYTLELDGGEDITASIDGGDPVSVDENNNIDLKTPDNVCKQITTPAGTFNAYGNNISINDLGKPVYNLRISQRPYRTQAMSAFCVIWPTANASFEVFDLFGGYCRIDHREVSLARGNMYVAKCEYGMFTDAIIISGASTALYINVLTDGYSAGQVLKEFDEDNNPVKVTFSKSDWKNSVSCKGITRDEFVQTYTETAINYIYKPIVEDNSNQDNNMIFPYLIFDVNASRSSVEPYESYGDVFYYIDHLHLSGYDQKIREGHWMFRDCYVNSMVKDGQSYDPVYRLPLYSNGNVKGGWHLLDFCLTDPTVSRDDRDYHCTVEDPYGVVLFDIRMKSKPMATTDHYISKVKHIYKWIRFDEKSKSYITADNINF